MKSMSRLALTSAVLFAVAGSAGATTFDINLFGDPSQFTEDKINSGGFIYDLFDVDLSGLDASDAFQVSQGDIIDSTVSFSGPVTVPTASTFTGVLQFLRGSSFPSEDTSVTGTFNFYDGVTLVRTFAFDSSTSGQLASFAANSPPVNASFTFDSYTATTTINELATPATLDGSGFEYALVSPSVPEPAAWAMMLTGFGVIGAKARARTRRLAA